MSIDYLYPTTEAVLSLSSDMVVDLRQTALQILHESRPVAALAGWTVEHRAVDTLTLTRGRDFERNGRFFICHDAAAGVVLSYWQITPQETTATVRESSVLLCNGTSSRQLERRYVTARMALGKLLPEPTYSRAEAYEVLMNETLTEALSVTTASDWQQALATMHGKQRTDHPRPSSSTRRRGWAMLRALRP